MGSKESSIMSSVIRRSEFIWCCRKVTQLACIEHARKTAPNLRIMKKKGSVTGHCFVGFCERKTNVRVIIQERGIKMQHCCISKIWKEKKRKKKKHVCATRLMYLERLQRSALYYMILTRFFGFLKS